MERDAKRFDPADEIAAFALDPPEAGHGGVEVGATSAVGWPALVRMLIDCMPWPAALVGDDLSVAFANRRARDCPLLRTLGWQSARPAALARAEADQPLQRALRRSLAERGSEPVTLRLTAPGQSLPACVVVQPLPEAGLCTPQALVTVHDPQATPAVDRLLLTRMFGLTPAEARVAARLVEGQAPEEIAQASGTSIQTVRSQLQAVFSKLAVNRQAVLVRMLLSLPPAISIPPNTSSGN